MHSVRYLDVVINPLTLPRYVGLHLIVYRRHLVRCALCFFDIELRYNTIITSTETTIMELYKNASLSLLTDMYQLTMGQGYWKLGKHTEESVFQMYFRKTPFKGSYAISCGLEIALQYLEAFEFTESDEEYLRSQKAGDGSALFDEGYIKYLGDMKLDIKVSAVTEGELIFANEPLLRIEGPLIQCQLLETPLLTIIGFQTLVATKANRVCRAATVGDVLEFGLRRAQGIDGGVSMSRAAHIGGCAATSNVLAGKLFNIPVKGTHSHSWVMSFPEEKESFASFAKTSPNNCILLIDTYDTLEGIDRAIEVGLEMKNSSPSSNLLGIRLDSGDLAELSIVARKKLDAAGLTDAKIVASDDLDEHRIALLISHGAKIDMWGVGTRIASCFDQPALGCVYKVWFSFYLSKFAKTSRRRSRAGVVITFLNNFLKQLAAIRKDSTCEWNYTMKAAAACPQKASIPGILEVMRHYDDNGMLVSDEVC